MWSPVLIFWSKFQIMPLSKTEQTSWFMVVALIVPDVTGGRSGICVVVCVSSYGMYFCKTWTTKAVTITELLCNLKLSDIDQTDSHVI